MDFELMIVNVQRQMANRINTKEEKKPIKLVLDLMTLNLMCRYVLCQSRLMRVNHFINLRKVIQRIDPSTYENDPEKRKRFQFILRGTEARIEKRLSDKTMLLVDINGGLPYDVDFIDYNAPELAEEEIRWITNLVSETLQYTFIYQKMDRMLDICTRFNTTTYENRGMIVQELEQLVDDLKNEFRKSKIEDNSVDMTFSLRENIFENVIRDTWDILTNPSRRLVSGMSGLNEMIGGGFEAGRVYFLFACTGIGKSITLLNILNQIKKYNTNYKTKDPTKTPCVVLLTMENTVVETITRLFDMVTNSPGMGMADYPVDEVLYKLRNEGQLILNDVSPIDIVIKYKANKSVDTSYLYTLYDDLLDEGYEMICLIQDHVKRIRSIYGGNDIRLELGDVVNEFKVFAAEKDIPVISNSHLNRDAARVLEETVQKGNKVDVTMKLGKSNVGESMLMLDNLDCGIIINTDFDEQGNKYMCFSLIKMRDKTERMYIAQPFVPGSGIRMVEDIEGVPMFRENLHMNDNIQRHPSIRTGSANVITSLEGLIDPSEEDRKDNIFSQDNNRFVLPKEEEVPTYAKKDVTSPLIFHTTGNALLDTIRNELPGNTSINTMNKAVKTGIVFFDNKVA